MFLLAIEVSLHNFSESFSAFNWAKEIEYLLSIWSCVIFLFISFLILFIKVKNLFKNIHYFIWFFNFYFIFRYLASNPPLITFFKSVFLFNICIIHSIYYCTRHSKIEMFLKNFPVYTNFFFINQTMKFFHITFCCFLGGSFLLGFLSVCF